MRCHYVAVLTYCTLQKAKAKPGPKKAAAPKTSAPKAKAAPKKTTQTTLKPKAKPAASKKRTKPDSEDEESGAERGSLHDASLLSATPPSAKKQKKGPAPKKIASKPLRELENGATGLDGIADPKPKKGTGATDQYQKVCDKFPLPISPKLNGSLAYAT